MLTLIQCFGSFCYSVILSFIFLWIVLIAYTRILVFAEGFLNTAGVLLGFVFIFAWLSEKGLQIASIPFNWLWSTKTITRLCTIIPCVIIALWGITAPFRIPFHFNIGDWIVTFAFWIVTLCFFWNLATMPIISPEVGTKP